MGYHKEVKRMSKIIVVPVTLELDGVTFTDSWRLPAITVEEMNILHDGFIDQFGSGVQNLFDATGAPSSVCTWIFENMRLGDSRISFYYDTARSGAYALSLVEIFKRYFPIFDENKNYYDFVSRYITYTENAHYRNFNVNASNQFGSVNNLSLTTARPDVIDSGYNIFSISSGGGFVYASHLTGRDDFFLSMSEYVIDDNDNIIGEIPIVFEGYGSADTIGAYVYPQLLVPNEYNGISTFAGTLREFVTLGNYVVMDDDPYSLGGNSGAGGGTGTFSDGGTPVGIPSLPTLSAVDTGFITLYNPSESQLQALASYMWSGPFDLDTYKKIFADPMNAILGLSIVPVDVPAGTVNSVKVGNIDTGITMTTARGQYVSVDCGYVSLPEHWGAYLDFDPYTKLDLYLPYIGIRPVSADCIIGKSTHIVYHVDILSGACSCYVAVNGAVLYTFIGQCSASIPITGDNWTNVINGTLSIAGAVGSMVATGGASAPMAISTIASTSVNAMKPSIEKSGAMSGTGGMLSGQTPYFIVTRPEQALPVSQNHFTGYPSFINRKLEDLNGYTEIELIHLENIPATSEELSEIETLLKGGVIL